MIANRIKPVFVVGMMLAATLSSPSRAGDRDYSRWHYLSVPAGVFVSNSDLAAFVSKPGIFSGTFDVARTASRSVYILRNYRDTPFTSPVISMTGSELVSPSVKIINVAGETEDAFAPVNACSWEAGVCVIRGGN